MIAAASWAKSALDLQHPR